MTFEPLDIQSCHETLYRGRLPNGLPVYYRPRPGFHKMCAVLAIHYGSTTNRFRIGETTHEVPAGIAHFLEHKLFESDEEDLFEQFSALGASVNAYTGHTRTVYHFTCNENFHESLQLLIGFVGTPAFTEAGIEKEKAIIGQEIQMYEDNPGWRVYTNLLRALYAELPLRIDITGTLESIAAINLENLSLCYRSFYNPSNMALVVSGDLDADACLTTATDAFAETTYPPATEVSRLFPDEPRTAADPELRDALDVARPRILSGFKDSDNGYDGPQLLRKDVEMEFCMDLLFGASSPFYQKAYDSGIIDDTFSAGYHGDRAYGFSTIGVETRDPARFRDTILETVEQAKRSGFSEDDFERLRRNYEGRFLRKLDGVESVAHESAAWLFVDVTYLRLLEILRDISLDAVETRLRDHFDEDAFATSLITPIEP